MINDIYISKHFKLREFESDDTHEVIIYPKLIRKLEQLRILVNQFLGTTNTPLIITSAYRTWDKHVQIYKDLYKDKWREKITKNSIHLTGKAVDLRLPNGITVDKFAKLAQKVGFDGIGKYNWGIHVDIRGEIARWSQI